MQIRPLHPTNAFPHTKSAGWGKPRESQVLKDYINQLSWAVLNLNGKRNSHPLDLLCHWVVERTAKSSNSGLWELPFVNEGCFEKS